MIRNFIESVTLTLHDFATLTASKLRVDPEIQRAHLEGRAELKDRRIGLKAAKTFRKDKITKLKDDHLVERMSLQHKQETEMQLTKEQTALTIEDARAQVRQAKLNTRDNLQRIRDQMLLQRLQRMVPAAAIGGPA